MADPVDNRGKPGDNVENGCHASVVGTSDTSYATLTGLRTVVVQGIHDGKTHILILMGWR